MKTNKLLTLLSAVAILSMAACAPAAGLSAGLSNAPVPQVSVVGVGQVYATPDIAYINVGVRTQADTVAEALELNNAQAKAIKDTLMGEGVDEKDIQTSSFNVYPQSEYDFQGIVVRTYFAVENSVYVTVRDLNNLGLVLDAVARGGANNIYGISFDVQDKTPSQSTARRLAVESAHTQAQELVLAAGMELGEIISISTYYSYPVPYYGYGMGGGGGGPAFAESVPIAAGQLQISSEVTMVFELK
ncbi:MAG TPA: SIMPL domain-containing protein [Pelolinea sp.]|nr:SIMPL domain-containing protein [Pelolinea sp.]